MYEKGWIKIDPDKKINVWLPESTDKWIIGGSEQARLLISDLWVAIKQVEGEIK